MNTLFIFLLTFVAIDCNAFEEIGIKFSQSTPPDDPGMQELSIILIPSNANDIRGGLANGFCIFRNRGYFPIGVFPTLVSASLKVLNSENFQVYFTNFHPR